MYSLPRKRTKNLVKDKGRRENGDEDDITGEKMELIGFNSKLIKCTVGQQPWKL